MSAARLNRLNKMYNILEQSYHQALAALPPEVAKIVETERLEKEAALMNGKTITSHVTTLGE